MRIAFLLVATLGFAGTIQAASTIQRSKRQNEEDDKSWFVEKMGYTIVEALANYGCNFDPYGQVFQERLTQASEKLAAELNRDNTKNTNFAAQFRFLGTLARKVAAEMVNSYNCVSHPVSQKDDKIKAASAVAYYEYKAEEDPTVAIIQKAMLRELNCQYDSQREFEEKFLSSFVEVTEASPQQFLDVDAGKLSSSEEVDIGFDTIKKFTTRMLVKLGCPLVDTGSDKFKAAMFTATLEATQEDQQPRLFY